MDEIPRETRNAITNYTFHRSLSFNLLDGFPLITTKKMFWKGIVEELLFFLRGDTNAKHLSDKGVRIWNLNTTREFLDNRGLSHYKEGDMGPMYGWQWRHFGANYQGCDANYTGIGFDQLADVINKIRHDPNNRRILMTDYNPIQVEESVLAPCHSIVLQFYCDGEYLDCTMYQRSADIFIGVPFNIASTSILLLLIATVTRRVARWIHINFGDLHLYVDHIDAAMEQLTRSCFPLPTIKIVKYDPEMDPITYLTSLNINDIQLENYQSHPAIKASIISLFFFLFGFVLEIYGTRASGKSL